ncbi:hypothetical protein MAQ5080_01524 [Marinomonas aquimarina]|uniref:Uncharacterized protein n=1 Tax=Marinomonas aquimarina TaxID=295068 RepID=A0A1A8TAH5_9GAMM|nr:hypothetical protein MAQ5080_01524 [Marinomonas aquimarina]
MDNGKKISLGVEKVVVLGRSETKKGPLLNE